MAAAFRASGPPPAGFTEDFTTGANADPLSGYSGWSPTTSWALDDNLGSTTRGMKYTGGSESFTTKDSTLANGTFTLGFGETVGDSIGYPSLVCRYTDDNNWIRLVGDFVSNTWKLQVYASGSLTLNYDTLVAYTAGPYTVQIVASGTSLQAKVATGTGTPSNAGSAQTSSDNTSATRVGMSVNGTRGVYFNTISAV